MDRMSEEIIEATQALDAELKIVREFQLNTEDQNQLVFFFKPEVFFEKKEANVREVLSLASGLFETFGVSVSGCAVLPGTKLAEMGSMDRHYGFINALSRGASWKLDEKQKAAALEDLGLTEAEFLGGHEVLLRYESFDPSSLEKFWATKKSKKLRSGMYVQSYKVDGRTLVIVNGFHPAQLEHFTGEDRRLVLMLVSSDLPWHVLRTYMLGNTFPERAVPGSFRRVLYDRARDLGFADVSIENNCAHMSAGPFEALAEMRNFLRPILGDHWVVADTRICQLAQEAGLSMTALDQLAGDVTLAMNGEVLSLYDLTEHCDCRSALSLFSAYSE